jgi:tryptophanyl-tRNA synthetase
MSLQPGTPDARTASGAMTPGTIATTLSKMDFPAPTGLKLNLPSGKGPGK